MGGLGNQLFQIFATLAYGLEHRCKVVFPYSHTISCGIARCTYWDNLLHNFTIFTTKTNAHGLTNTQLSQFPQYKEQGHAYNKIPKSDTSNLLLFGYFQSHLYFDKYMDQFTSILRLSEQQLDIKTKYIDYFANNNNDICSMHFRLGDYKQIQECHPLMKIEYYKKAVEEMNAIKHIGRILYFCEEQDNHIVDPMINELQSLHHHIDFVKVDDQIPDWQQMLLMSVCDHNIIANSSFSWWGAYLNQNKHKNVCYPEIWFGPKLCDKDVSNMFPYNWIKV
jgi:hypothetical protein